MSWIVRNWRLKLLALVLTVALLGAVAFSENPPQITSVPVKLEFQPSPGKLGLVLTRYPTTVDVPVIGLASAVEQFRSSSAGATVDLSHAKPGSNQTFQAQPKGGVAGVTFPEATVPITLTIEAVKTATLEVEVQTPNRLNGIQIVQSQADCGSPNGGPCQVTVSGPQSLLDGMRAFVLYDSLVTTSFSSPSQKIRFSKGGTEVDMTGLHYDAAPSWTPAVATVNVEVKGGTATKTVTITTALTGTQACGYVINGITYSPSPTVNLTGPTDVVARIQSVAIDPIGITGLNQTLTVTRAIKVPDPSVSVNPSQVQAILSVSRAFSCTAPTPTPAPSPSP